MLIHWVLDKCSVGNTVLGKTVCFILSVDHLRLELGSRGWEGSTCTNLPFPGSHPGGITLCLDGGFSWWWITSLLNTLEAEIFCCQFSGICHHGWLIHLSCIMAGEIYIFPHVTIRISREIESVVSKLVICHSFFISCFWDTYPIAWKGNLSVTPVHSVCMVLLCTYPLLLVNFQRFSFQVQESFYFKNALKSSERLDLMIHIHRLLKLVPYTLRRKILFWSSAHHSPLYLMIRESYLASFFSFS